MNKLMKLLPAALVTMTACAPAFAMDSLKLGPTDLIVESVAMMPARVLGVATGAIVGVPIATVRATAKNTMEAQGKIAGALPEADSPASEVYSSVLSLPVGLLCGLVEGPYYGLKNASHGFRHPFSAESFSLQDDGVTN